MLQTEVDLIPTMDARRKRAAQELGQLELEDVPDPAALCRQLRAVYESGDLR